MTEHLHGYISYLRIKNYTNETIRNYTSVISAFEHYCETKNTTPLTISRSNLREYFTKESTQHRNPITINGYRRIIKAYYKYLTTQHLLPSNPIEQIPTHKQGTPLASFVPMDEMKKLFSLLDQTDTYSLRDITMFEFFYSSGIRTMELCKGTTHDLNLAKEQFKVVQGKGRKDRIVPLPHKIIFLLEHYLPMRQFRWPTSDYLFPNTKGKQLKQGNVYKTIKSFLDLTSSKKKGAHTLRHTYATHLLGAGANILDVKELLGHQSAATTQVYDHNNIDRLLRVFKKAHPKA